MQPYASGEGWDVYRADALDVAAEQAEDSFSLAIIDGPYAMNKAAWDRMKVVDLPDWYRPHLEAAGRILAPSASLYLWNTAEGWATLHPLLMSLGWTFRSLIVWEKTGAHPARIGAANSSRWPDVTEVCGHYARGNPFHKNQTTGNVWALSPTTAINDERVWADAMCRDRVSGAMQRIGLHPCQKPLLFAERMIRASTRPGERVWVPFGGTCREALVCANLARQSPDDARHCVTAEIDQDGKGYLDAVIPLLRGLSTNEIARQRQGQTLMFEPG